MNKVLKIMMFIVLGVAAFILFGWAIQSLWNILLPELFGWKSITFWQAMGLFILSKILFGGFTSKCKRGEHSNWGMGYWKHKWTNMSPEQKEKIKQRMRERCGWDSESSAPTSSSDTLNK